MKTAEETKKLTAKEKKALLVKLVKLRIKWGFSVEELIGKPLSFFDYERIKDNIEGLKKWDRVKNA